MWWRNDTQKRWTCQNEEKARTGKLLKKEYHWVFSEENKQRIVLNMAHTAVLWLFRVFFITLEWLIHILKKTRKFWPVLNFTHGTHTHMQNNNKFHRKWIFYCSIFNFSLYVVILFFYVCSRDTGNYHLCLTCNLPISM